MDIGVEWWALVVWGLVGVIVAAQVMAILFTHRRNQRLMLLEMREVNLHLKQLQQLMIRGISQVSSQPPQSKAMEVRMAQIKAQNRCDRKEEAGAKQT